MAPDLRLVSHAAHGDPDELAARRAGDGLAQTCLAGSRWPHEAQDRTPQRGVGLAHGQELHDALLDLLQTKVILLENLLGFAQPDGVFRLPLPR